MRLLRSVSGALLVLLAFALPSAQAQTVEFGGKHVAVPDGWPVYRLAEHPRMCVRLDRRAVYVGTPGAAQRCPAEAIGRRRAILLDPAARARPAAKASAGVATPVSGSDDYTGLGFDACAAPSGRTMDAWSVSPYRAIGVYIGGINRACSQPNLTASWVSEQVAEGWHLIPTYVGLQSPTGVCSSCAEIIPSRATTQGTEAAIDAVEDAQSIGMGPGSPIYYDMEAYTRTSSATATTLTFLSAWTTQLHALGYVSGVYSSSGSGIADLGRAIGGPYALPDHIWHANWNGAQNTLDPYFPSTAWADHQRIHQYRGGHNETWGLTTINIDNNYVEGATVGIDETAAPVLPPLTVRNVRVSGGTVRVWVRCGWSEGETCPGRLILRTNARLPMRARPGVPTKVVRIAVSKRSFYLAGGRSHTFRLALDSRGKPLLRLRGILKAQLLVAIPQSRATRSVSFSLVR
jgi:hypothetical protein